MKTEPFLTIVNTIQMSNMVKMQFLLPKQFDGFRRVAQTLLMKVKKCSFYFQTRFDQFRRVEGKKAEKSVKKQVFSQAQK